MPPRARNDKARARNNAPNNDRDNNDCGWWFDLRQTPCMLLFTLIGVLVAYWSSYDAIMEHFEYGARFRTINSIAASAVQGPRNYEKIVQRVNYTQKVEEFLARNLDDEPGYMVVVGPRGCGKSTVVLDALKNRPGTIVKRFGSASGPEKLFDALLAPHVSERFRITEENDLRDLFLDVQSIHFPDDPSWRPTIVAEIDRGVKDDVIVETTKTLKRIGADLGAAHVIVVLSDANAAFALPDDPARQEILWVDDLTEAEAHEFFDRRKAFMRAVHVNGSVVEGDKNGALRAHLFLSVGTRAADLVQAVTKSKIVVPGVSSEQDSVTFDSAKLNAFIKDRLAMASVTVQNLASLKGGTEGADGAAFTRLIRELLQTTDEIGVPVEKVDEYLVAPDEAARMFKRYHAVLYHIPSRTYRFHSTAHRRGAEQLLAEEQLGSFDEPKKYR